MISTPVTTHAPRPGTTLIHVGFVLTGVMTTLLGPTLPILSARWSLNDVQAGYLFTSQFASSIIGVAISSWLIQRRGYRLTLMLGMVLMGLGAGVLATANWKLGLTSVGIYGAGYGVTSATANLLISELNPTRRAAALNLLNFSWGIGAVGCPFLVAILQRANRMTVFWYGMALLLALEALCLALIRLPTLRSETRRPGTSRIWKTRLFPILGALFFVYVGTETSVGGWIASYARRIDVGPGTFWVMTPSFFWGALLVGRATAPLLLRRMRETSLASAGLVLSCVGVAVLLAAHGMTSIVLGAALTGLGLSSVFPINISLISRWFGDEGVRFGGVMFALAGLGGATLPWLVGLFSALTGNLKAGLVVPFLGSATMLVLYLANRAARSSAGS
jgi:FHS family glucose/mannose:H+ symporter-like MFS transporter